MKKRNKKLIAGMLAASLAAAPVMVCASELPAGDEGDAAVRFTQEEIAEYDAGEETDEVAIPLSDEDVHPLRADGTAFAVYCETDGSLTFYADTAVPAAGESYAGKAVTKVYTGFETEEILVWSNVPWSEDCSKFLSVTVDSSFADVKPLSTKFWFRYFINCESMDLKYLDTSAVTDMEGMFWECSSITEIDMGGKDVSRVTDMSEMFYYCSSLTRADVSGWDTGSVTDMRAMFEECCVLTTVDTGGWDVKNVVNLGRMFYDCYELESVDVSGWDTGSVTNLTCMFWECGSVKELDVSGWDTDDVTNMYCTFYRCRSLTGLDLSSWNTQKVTTCVNFAITCSSLEWIEIGSGFDLLTRFTNKLVSQQYWYDSPRDGTLVSDDYMLGVSEPGRYYSYSESVFAVYSSEDRSMVFYKDTAVPEAGGTYRGKAVTYVYTGIENTNSDIQRWNTIRELVKKVSFDSSFADVQPSSTSFWFYNFINCEEIDLTNLDTSCVTDMSDMFYDCRSLGSLELTKLDTSKVTNMHSMFYHCTKLTEMDVSHFNTSNVTQMGYMFCDCGSVTSLDLSNFDTSKVTDMIGMFGAIWYGVSSLESLDLSSFDTGSATDMTNMFYNCSSLRELDVSSFDTSSVTSYGNFAVGCTSLDWIKIGDGFELFTRSSNKLVSQQDWYDGPEYGSHLSYNYMIGIKGEGTYWTYSSYGFGMSVVDADGTALSGAEFTLTDAEGNQCLFVKDGDTYTLCSADTSGASSVIVSTASWVQIEGLEEGEYTLTETKAAAGYALLAYSAVVTVSDEGIILSGAGSKASLTGDWSMQLVHDSQVIAMPNTGGAGTAGILLAGLVVLLCSLAGALRIVKHG